jgi:hypothetical protein
VKMLDADHHSHFRALHGHPGTGPSGSVEKAARYGSHSTNPPPRESEDQEAASPAPTTSEDQAAALEQRMELIQILSEQDESKDHEFDDLEDEYADLPPKQSDAPLTSQLFRRVTFQN